MTATLLQTTDPAAWSAQAFAWRGHADAAGRWSAELRAHLVKLSALWSGAAAGAALACAERLRRRLDVVRLVCWRADQAVSEFAAALRRARVLLPAAPEPAVAMARSADSATSVRLAALCDLTTEAVTGDLPPCGASPAVVRTWWDGLSAAQQRWLVTVNPSWIAALDGVLVADRDAANRSLLEGRRAELDEAIRTTHGHERNKLTAMRDGLFALTDRLADSEGPRAYLVRLDLAGEGRAVVALGDPDRATDVLTQVPGMTADLASYDGERARAERVADRAAQAAPDRATSTVLWLDYDAPDFVGEAASPRQAEAGAVGLRRFQDGLRATHLDAAAHQTVLGHSYGSLVVGNAAAQPGLQADDVIFVGSPGVGVQSANELHAGQVWSSTSRSDVIQYLPVAPKSVALAALSPLPAALLTVGRPADDLWFGRNPSDPDFGARVFASEAGGGHLGYWERGSTALDAITRITVGRDVIPQ